jgi:hypothetical protein
VGHKPLKSLMAPNQWFRGIVCFQWLNRRFISRSSRMRPLDPRKAKLQQTAEQPQKGSAAADRMRTNPQERSSLGRAFLAISKKWNALPALTLSEHPIRGFSKREALTFLIPWSAIGDPSQRRWLEGQNPIAAYAGDRLSGQADNSGWNSGIAQITVVRQERGQRVIHLNASLAIADPELRLSFKARKQAGS